MFIASPILVLASWEALVRLHVIEGRFFPAPSWVFVELARMFLHGRLLADVDATLLRIGVGVLIGFVPGVVLGMMMGLLPWARSFFSPLVALTYPIPKIAILPLLLIIFGIGELSNVMMVAIGVFYFGLINTFAGVRQISRIHFEVAKVYGIGRASVFWRIVLPASFPGIFTGLRLGVGYALILIVASEMVASNAGLGHRIWLAWETYLIRELYACLAVISIIGIFLAVILEKIEQKLIPWKV